MRNSRQAAESCRAWSTPTPEQGKESMYNRKLIWKGFCEGTGAGTNRLNHAYRSETLDSHITQIYLPRPQSISQDIHKKIEA